MASLAVATTAGGNGKPWPAPPPQLVGLQRFQR